MCREVQCGFVGVCILVSLCILITVSPHDRMCSHNCIHISLKGPPGARGEKGEAGKPGGQVSMAKVTWPTSVSPQPIRFYGRYALIVQDNSTVYSILFVLHSSFCYAFTLFLSGVTRPSWPTGCWGEPWTWGKITLTIFWGRASFTLHRNRHTSSQIHLKRAFVY